MIVDRFALGLSAATLGESLFSVEETARANRLFRLVDSGGAIMPAGTAWDGTTTYGTLVVRAMGLVSGESTFLLANAGGSTAATSFFAGSSTAPGSLTRPGDNVALRDVVAIAANASWIFVLGNVPIGTTTQRTVFRIPRATPTVVPTPLAPASELSLSSTNGSMAYDPVADILYFRTTSTPTAVHAIWGASTATPTWVGPVVTRGRGGDHGLAIDPSIPALFLFETETSIDGAFAEIR